MRFTRCEVERQSTVRASERGRYIWRRGLALASLAVCCSATAWKARGNARDSAAQERASMHVTRVYSGSDGLSHAEDVETKLGAADQLGLRKSEAVKTTSANFARFPGNFFEDWHCAHARRYVITLTGRGEAEVAGGQKVPMEPGRVVLFEDMTGKGHISRALTADWTAVFVQLDEK
jgi:hypothetical protein